MESKNIAYRAIERETEAAMLIKFEGRTEWMPKSQVTVNEDGTVTMPSWLAAKKHLVATAADRRADRMFANMKKEVEAARNTMTEDEKNAADEAAKVRAIYCHYDKRRNEYYAIDVNGKRHYA